MKEKKQLKQKESVYPIRINKYLALKGYSTRRGADEIIEKKQVFINGKLARPGDKVNEYDQVEVKWRGQPKEFVYYAYHKPKGIITHSAQEEDEEEIKEVFPIKGVFPVGRLDKDSSGLIILTNDGRVTDRILNPIHEHEKEYIVRTKGKLRNNFKEKMERGVNIEGYITKPCKIEILNENSFKITLTEGKKHQIRRMVVALFQEVAELKRTRIMNIKLEKLKPKQYRKIEGKELENFFKNIGL